jgi:hypothetical protein
LCDTASEIPGSYTFVVDGTANKGTGWVQTVTDPATFVVGTDPILITQFSGAGTYTAGTGLSLTGTEFAVSLVPVANGGTGQTTANAALNAFLPSQSSNAEKFLKTDGTNTSWANVPSPNNGTLTMAVSGTGLSGSASFTADQSGNSTFTVTSNATSTNTAGAIVARDGSGDFAAGSAVFSGNVTSSSDERLKKNWRPVGDDFVTKLAGVKSGIYDRTDIESTQAGVSAQALEEVLAEVVVTAPDGLKSVNYGNAALVAAIELAKQVVELRKEIAELKGK